MNKAIVAESYPITIPVIKRSGHTDGLIRVREALLNRLSGVKHSPAINAQAAAETLSPSIDLAAQIRTTLLKLKATAMDAYGTAVDYNTLRNDPAYTTYQHKQLAALQQFNPQNLPTEEAARAFWINLYNALVLDAVINLNVQESVTEGFVGMLTFFRRAAYIVNRQRVSLSDIEYGILRGNRGNPYIPGVHFASNDPRLDWALPLDPRIHFTLNCGGRSCPPIRAYTTKQLSQQLNLATRGYLDATVVVNPEQNELVLSQIFRWFGSDFGGHAGIVELLGDYLPDDERRQTLLVDSNNLKFSYEPYDWRLNVT